MRRIAEKITSVEEARARMAAWRAENRGIVLATGAFDPLEAADARELAAAHEHGRHLVVAVADDEAVRKLLGVGRPVVPLEDRCRVVAALATVDLVIEGWSGGPVEPLGFTSADRVIAIGRTPDLVSRIRARLGRAGKA